MPCAGRDSRCRRREREEEGRREEGIVELDRQRKGQGRPLPPSSCARPSIYLFYMVSSHLQGCACRYHATRKSATGFLNNPIATRWNSHSSKLGPTLGSPFSYSSLPFSTLPVLSRPSHSTFSFFPLCLWTQRISFSSPLSSPSRRPLRQFRL